MNISDSAIEFLKNLFHVYIEKRDFDQFSQMLDKDISWIGTGAREICPNYKQAEELISIERDSWDGTLKILKQWYNSIPINNEYCTVYGGLTIEKSFLSNSMLIDMTFRFSMLCKVDSNGFKLVHAHFSVPDIRQSPDEFAHQSTIQEYSMLLEQQLEQRTKMLHGKTRELEILMKNIHGGIQICKYDEDFSVLFVNDGFYELVGYHQQEISKKFHNHHVEMILKSDLELLKKDIQLQLKTNKKFFVEYKIKRKDGTIIWVIDKGRLVTTENGEQQIQCVLTDITKQKRLEKELHLKTLELLTKNKELIISKKRYEIAIKHSDAILFDYMIESKKIIYPSVAMRKFGLPHVVKNAMDSTVWSRIIHPNSMDNFRSIYQKIDHGETFAETTIFMFDAQGAETLNQVSLTNILDERGKPFRAIGLMTDITELSLLEKEKQFRQAMLADNMLVYEANITQNTMIDFNKNSLEMVSIPECNTFSDMVDYISNNFVHPDYIDIFEKFSSKQEIIRCLKSGQTQASIQYQRKNSETDYIWVENTMTVIQDDMTKDIKIRCHINSIGDKKAKELKALEEQQFYKAMISKSAIVYEVNITKDTFIRGRESWDVLFGIEYTDSYSQMMEAIAAKALHPDDASAFTQVFVRENVLSAYSKGIRELYCEYRRPDESGKLIWVSCTMHLLEDPTTNHIKGFSYIHNINDDKLKELDLIYKAEHDALTGLYNKSITEQLIDSYFQTDEGKMGKHAFYILDIDYFKSINDNFGHAFGDAVLSQVSRKIKDLFREGDILGRIGGDEFVILMKNITNTRALFLKAQELCELIKETYTKNGKRYGVSVSVGIAMYQAHGLTYQDLYTHSDTALYIAKQNGRDQFALYNHHMCVGEITSKKNIDVHDLLETKSFEENVSEYVFRILYESPDKKACIASVLELMGKRYNVSRVYIFEDSKDSLYTSNTFEWCNEKSVPQIDNLKNIPYAVLDDYKSNFNDMGIFYLPDIQKASKSVKKILEPQHVKSMLQFAILKNDIFSGFVGFDQCECATLPTKQDITDLRNVANILGVFLMEMRAIDTIESTKNVVLSIVNGLDSYAYVIDKEQHELLFINKKTKQLVPDSKVGNRCYESFWNRDAPCENCPMGKLSDQIDSKCTIDLYNHNYHVWIKATASWIYWTDGKRACLVDSVDITSYKQHA